MRITRGYLKNNTLATPKGKTTRPTTERLRQAVYNVLSTTVEESSFLDLFAGSGAMGFEAISCGAKHVTFVENSSAASKCIRENIQHLHVENCTRLLSIKVEKALLLLEKEQTFFDLIYADPPYEKGFHAKLLSYFSTSSLLSSNSLLMIEERQSSSVILSDLNHVWTLQKRLKQGESTVSFYQKKPFKKSYK